MMTRRCSHCSNNGHNSRTCPTRSAAPTGGGGGPSSLSGVKLFGVRLTDGSIIKKSASMGNLSVHYHSSSAASPNPDSPVSDHARDSGRLADGYLSDDMAHASSSSNRRGDRKKGVPWTEEEHRLFLIGLQKLGKGDWRGIARNYVVSRTPTQVASHAQKYFIRQSNATRRKRRSSLFDMVTDVASDPQSVPEEKELLPLQAKQSDSADNHPSLNLSLKPEYEPMETTSEEPSKEEESNKTMMGSSESIQHVPRPTQFTQLAPSSSEFTPFVHQFVPAYVPVPYPFWPANSIPAEESMSTETSSSHQVLRPVAVVPKQPVNVDELVGISNLSIGEHSSPPLSLKLTAEASRHSAFHANAPGSRSEIRKGKGNAIQAV
ncbi:Transcription factor MYBS3 [Linum perenne]